MAKKEKKFSAGEVIYKQGEPCTHVYTIVEGRAEMFYEINGNARVLGKKTEDDILGANSVLEGTYDTSARAETDLTVFVQTSDEYISQLQKSGELSPGAEEKDTDFTFDTGDDDGGDDFDFDFGGGFGNDDEEEFPSSSRSGRRRSTALSGFSFGDDEEEEGEKNSKKALVKVEKKIAPPVAVKPKILPAEIKRSPITEWFMEGRAEPLAFGPVLLLASFEGDDGGGYRDMVYDILKQVPNLQVRAVNGVINDENVSRAALQMRSWMKQHEADIGLYAKLDNAGRVLEFHTVRSHISSDIGPSLFGPGSRFFLPVDMKHEHKTLLKVFTVSEILPTRLEHEQLLRLFLPVVLTETDTFGTTPMVGLSTEEQAVNLACYANALSLVGAYNPQENTYLRTASVYEAALKLLPPYAPEYVFINRQVGLIHQVLGEKMEDAETLKKAEETFSKATEVLSKSRQPEAWGDLKIRIGNVRQKIAVMTGGGDDFALAMNAYREALGVLKASTHTEKWADAMNGLARTMQVFGAHSTKTTLLEKSIELYEKELEILDRDLFPKAWASACNNLASALFLLFDKKNDPALIQKAVGVFSDALAVYDKLGARKMATIASSNLKRAEKVLSETEKTLEQKTNWLEDILEEAEPGEQPLETPEGEEEPLVFERIAVFEELEDE